jgi:kynureninase
MHGGDGCSLPPGQFACELDKNDPLKQFRDRFELPSAGIALVFVGGVNFLAGELLDIARLALAAAGVDVDVREADVIRLAPAPLFNTYHEVWRAAHLIARQLHPDEC